MLQKVSLKNRYILVPIPDLCLLCEQLPPPLRPVTSLSTASLLLRYLLACSSTTLPQAARILLMKDGLVCLSLKQEV
jgi:hypothetical protein